MTLVATVAASAQTQVATLSSAGNISTYYGPDALKTAYEAAADGNVITLSEGDFYAVDSISKIITIRGAGMGLDITDTTASKPRTILKGDFQITTKGTPYAQFVLEGITHNGVLSVGGEYPQITKCKLSEVKEVYGDTLYNGSFIHCHVQKKFAIRNTTTTACLSCYIQGYEVGIWRTYRLTNCIIEGDFSSLGSDLSYTTNSIYINTSSNSNTSRVYTGTDIYNCLWVGLAGNASETYPYSPFAGTIAPQNNHVFPKGSTLFVEGTFCQLTEAAKQYKGTDGTEVGIYGGDLPFDPTPSVPQITKFEVAPKTTADGKLSVDIEISQP